jgi:formate-dependent nitrite reductase membrane component NrfD
MMDDWREESLAEDISPVGVAAVVLFILGLVCLTIELGAPAIERPMSAPTSTSSSVGGAGVRLRSDDLILCPVASLAVPNRETYIGLLGTA